MESLKPYHLETCYDPLYHVQRYTLRNPENNQGISVEIPPENIHHITKGNEAFATYILGNYLKQELEKDFILSEYPVLITTVNNLIEQLQDKRNVSDGSHTFEELYHHRAVLFSTLCRAFPENAWKSKLHDDGTMFENYFIVGIQTPEGSFTYHYEMKYWEMFPVTVYERAPVYDGHTASDVTRLFSLLEKGEER